MTATRASGTAGAQTLARGLTALKMIVAARDGMSVQELGDALGVHRSIAYRILSALAEAALVAKGSDNRYRGAVGLLALTSGAFGALHDAAVPIMRSLADEIEATVSLFVTQGGEAIALAVVAPENARYRILFSAGSTHPLDRGAAGHALLSLLPEGADDSEQVREVRRRGYASTYAEVEPGAYGLAVPLALGDERVPACLNLITYRQDQVQPSIERMMAAASELSRLAR